MVSTKPPIDRFLDFLDTTRPYIRLEAFSRQNYILRRLIPPLLYETAWAETGPRTVGHFAWSLQTLFPDVTFLFWALRYSDQSQSAAREQLYTPSEESA